MGRRDTPAVSAALSPTSVGGGTVSWTGAAQTRSYHQLVCVPGRFC